MKKHVHVYKSAAVASLAGLLFGFDTVVISGAEQTIQSLWQLSGGMHGLAISMALWGTLFGALVGGLPSEKLGRRKTLILIGFLYLISAIGSALAPEVYSFMLFRFLGGLGIGVSTVAAPLFISEIAPAKERGRLTGLFQFNIVLGILLAFLSNALLGEVGSTAWRWMLGVEAVPAIAYVFLTIGLPESPRWLIVNQRDLSKATQTLQRINPFASEHEVNLIVDEIRKSSDQSQEKAGFFSKALVKPISLAILIAVFNQLSGINAILYFAPRIFELTGLGASSALLQSIGIGAVNLVFTLVGLRLIDHWGRKTLLYLGSVGYILSLGLCAWAFHFEYFGIVPYCIFAFIAAHAVGQGAVIWVFIGEIFPNKHRSSGQALGSFTHWLFAASLTLVFPIVVERVQPAYIFGFFALMMMLQLVWVKLKVPETKGVSLEQMNERIN